MSTPLTRARQRRIDPAMSRMLDAARGLAALAVVLQHARTYLFTDLSFLPPQPLAVRAFYFATGFGHAAVMVFFVLSGMLVGGSALDAIETGRWSWRRYLTQRLTRLWIVLIPALVLTSLWDHAGRFIVAHPQTLAAHDHTIALGDRGITVGAHGIGAFLGNAAFVQSILVPTFGTNGSLWSLANEFWYYLLFPLAALTIASRADSWRSVRCVVAFGAIAWLVGTEILSWGTLWLMGVVVARAPRVRLRPRLATAMVLVTALAFGLALCYGRVAANQIDLTHDLAAGASFAALLYAMTCRADVAAPAAPPWFATRFAATIAGFGYTLYLVHEPPLALARVWIIAGPHHRWTPTAMHGAGYAGIVVAILAYAFLLSRLTEARTDALRRWLASRAIDFRIELVRPASSLPAAPPDAT